MISNIYWELIKIPTSYGKPLQMKKDSKRLSKFTKVNQLIIGRARIRSP